MDFLTLNIVSANSASGIKEETMNDLNAAKVAAMKAAELGEFPQFVVNIFSSIFAPSQGSMSSLV